MSSTVILSKPIKVEGQEVYELTLREPVVKDLRAMGKVAGEIEQNVELISLLANVPKSSLDQVSARDYGKLQEIVMVFLADSPITGEN